jgi:D-glycero-D-manno-heptose 1,7-bisphosphate phosphatase
VRYPAIFLDRDGTLIEDVGYASRPEDIRILGGTATGLARLAEAGYKLIVITNQSGIARGLLSESDLTRFHAALDDQLNLLGVRVDAYYACPHYPDPAEVVRKDLAVDCECRKPKPGMILRAAEDLRLDLESSWMVGDSWRDIQAGQAAGLRTVKLPSASRDGARPPEAPPTAEAANLDEAADMILGLRDPAPREERREEPLPEEAGAATAEGPLQDTAPHAQEPAAEVASKTRFREAPSRRREVGEPASITLPDNITAADVDAGCARCGAAIRQADVASGAAGLRNGLLLCADCLHTQPGPAAERLPQDSSALLREVLGELRRMARARQGSSLSFVRLLAYILQAAALFSAIGMPLLADLKTPGQDRMMYLQIAILLQLLVVTLLVMERKS